MSRTSRAWEALQERLDQTVETVTRSARIDIVSGGVDEIDPPEDLDKFAEQARTTGPVRKNLRQFVNDVWEPGYRVSAESEQTEAYFEGGDNAPEGTPDGGFLANAGIFGGERHTDFYDFGKATTWQKWVRGTILVELLKSEPENPDSPITGFYHIRPETIYPQVQNNTNILLPADTEDLPDDVDTEEVEKTKRGEVAAYIQFDDESILGIRRGGFDRQQIPLSQNDVMKQVLDPDIGDDAGLADTQGVFGTSIIEGITEDIEEYKRIKRDRAEAIGRKAYGVWTAQATPETVERGNTTEVIEWSDTSLQNAQADLESMGPGDVFFSDANLDLEKFEPDVPELNPVIQQYINIMLAPLPAPKYMIGFAEGINRDVTSEQKEAYHDLLSQERRYQEKKWTPVLREVAERQGLNTDGLELKLEPQTEENPVKSLSTDEIDRMNTYVSTLNAAAGPQAGPTALVDAQELLEVLDFPVDDMDEPEDVVDELSTEETEAAWQDIMGVDALATQYSEGDAVQSPQGFGVVTEIRTEDFTGKDGDTVEASNNSPTYVVALQDARVGVGFYKASQLDATEFPETAVEDPEEALFDAYTTPDEALQVETTFGIPDSWEKSEKPARLILLDAWSSMGGTFRGARQELGSARLAASMKDRVLQWEGWRQ